MSVEFNEENNFNSQLYAQSRRTSAAGTSGLTAWIIKNGWAKDESQANAIMIGVTIVCFALAIFFAVK